MHWNASRYCSTLHFMNSTLIGGKFKTTFALVALRQQKKTCISSKIVKAKIVQLEEDDGSGPTKFDT